MNSVSNQNDFSNSRPPTTATHPCHMLLRLLERWELPTSARHNCRVRTLSGAGSRKRFVRFWSLHPPTSYSALAPRTSAARRTRQCKQICDILLHCQQDCRGTCTFRVVYVDVKSLLSNFSIRALSSQRVSMDRDRQQAVFTHFIKPFLSRTDSSGKSRRPGSIC